MYIESVLKYLGYNQNSTLVSEYFEMFTKGDSHLFIYESKRKGKRLFSSASGEFTGDERDLIVFFYNTQNSSMYNESERLQIFLELHKEDNTTQKDLTPIDNFNLYQILLKNATKHKDNVLVNCVETSTAHNFFFMDEEKIKSGRNLLGVVSLDKKTKKETILKFSELDRSIYFTNPSIKSDAAYIFNSFNEMLAFKERQTKDIFYIVVKGKFNENHAKTITMMLDSKGIKKTYLSFPGNLDGYSSDLNYLSVFGNIKIKSRTAYYKLNIPLNKESDLLIDKLKVLKSVVEKDLESLNINQLITLRESKDYMDNKVFVVELPKISNIIMSFLVLGSKYLFKDKQYKIIKPKKVFWSEDKAPIQNAEKEFKLNMFNSIKEIYAYN